MRSRAPHAAPWGLSCPEARPQTSSSMTAWFPERPRSSCWGRRAWCCGSPVSWPGQNSWLAAGFGLSRQQSCIATVSCNGMLHRVHHASHECEWLAEQFRQSMPAVLRCPLQNKKNSKKTLFCMHFFYGNKTTGLSGSGKSTVACTLEHALVRC